MSDLVDRRSSILIESDYCKSLENMKRSENLIYIYIYLYIYLLGHNGERSKYHRILLPITPLDNPREHRCQSRYHYSHIISPGPAAVPYIYLSLLHQLASQSSQPLLTFCLHRPCAKELGPQGPTFPAL